MPRGGSILCTRRMCRFRSLLRENLLVQFATGHAKGRFFSCTARMCVFKSSERENARPQMWQTCRLSASCVLATWRRRLAVVPKTWPHSGQGNRSACSCVDAGVVTATSTPRGRVGAVTVTLGAAWDRVRVARPAAAAAAAGAQPGASPEPAPAPASRGDVGVTSLAPCVSSVCSCRQAFSRAVNFSAMVTLAATASTKAPAATGATPASTQLPPHGHRSTAPLVWHISTHVPRDT